MEKSVFQYSEKEELVNSISHGIGVLVSAVSLIVLLHKALEQGSAVNITSVLIYGLSMIALFSASTFYHWAKTEKWKKFLKKADHICIYLLIAGSYTPFLLMNLKENSGYLMMSIVWSIAAVGILFKIFAKRKFIFLSVATYLGMGWLAVVAKEPLMATVPEAGLKGIVVGGLFYTVGVLFYLLKKMPFHHGIWHFFVLAGSFSHTYAVYNSF